MSGHDLYNELQELTQKLEQTLSALKKYGTERAQAEHDYKIGLRQEILRLREGGQPATLVLNLSYGTPNIAKLRLNRDIAENLHMAALEAINVYKLKIRLLDAQIEREWNK